MYQVFAKALRLAPLVTLCLIQVAPIPTSAAVRTWIGGNDDWIETAGADLNWNLNIEPDAADEAIFNTPNTVDMGTNNTILDLTLSGGIDLSTNSNDLTVSGTLSATGASTNFIIEGSTSLVDVDTIDVGGSATIRLESNTLNVDTVAINSAGTIRLDSGTMNIDQNVGNGFLDINAGGTLTGFGVVNLNDAPGAITSLLINDGVISASNPPLTIISPPTAATLEINSLAANARIKLDGGAEAGIVNINRNQTLEINGTLADAFSGSLNMSHETTLDISTAWSMDGGTFNVNTGFINNPIPTPDVPAGTATIAGGAFTQTGGTITNVDNDGTIEFTAAFTQTGGNFVNNGLVVFSGTTLIDDTANFTMPNNASSIRVGTGATVNVDQTNFNVDGNGTATNVITIGSGGILDLDLGAGADDTITGTLVLGGGELDVTTADNDWSLSGSVSTLAASGISQLNGENLDVSGNTVTVNAGSTLDVNATSDWFGGTALIVEGLATFDADVTMGGVTPILGNGTLRFNADSAVTNLTVATNTFDWDGTTAGHTHRVNSGLFLIIDSPNFDTDGDMDDNIMLGDASTLEVNGPTQWILEGTLTANLPLDPIAVTISGTSRFVHQGVLNVDGSTNITAPVTFGTTSTTSIDAGVTLDVTGAATYSGGSISGAGTYDPGTTNTVTADSQITATNFHMDAGTWTVQNNALLTINVGDYDSLATNAFDSTITLNSGEIVVNTASAEFVMDGVLNMHSSAAGAANWFSEPLNIGNDAGTLDADLNVTGADNAAVLIGSSVNFKSDADVNVAAGGILYFVSSSAEVSFNTVNGANNAEFTGAGEIRFNGIVNVNEAVTFNMTGGTVDLDGDDFPGDFINIGAPFVINAATLTDFGRLNSNQLDINSTVLAGVLTVNLDDPAAEWTLNGPGVMNLVNDNVDATLLAGSDVNLNGTVNVTGDVRVNARLDIGATGVVNILTANEPLRMNGGSGNSDPNTIAGGVINGPGILQSENASLIGFGTINAVVEFDAGFPDLLADNGTLTINGTIRRVDTLGTADADGVLNIPAAWETDGGPGNSILLVQMKGGQIIGGTITNDEVSGIVGFGTVAAQVINNSRLVGSFGTLVIQTAANNNDWDGGTNLGQLVAGPASTLELRDTALFGFTGDVIATSGGRVFANGFALDFNPGSEIELTGSTYESTHSTDIGGTVTVHAGSNAEITIAGQLTFEATSTSTITGTLNLNATVTQINAGATFTGVGTLRNMLGSGSLRLQNAAVDVLIENEATLVIGSGIPAQATGLEFQQDATGIWTIDLNGTSLANFDRFNLTGAAQVAGALDIELGGGYSPTIGDEFNILSANGGISGSFTLFQPGGLPAGTFFNARYESTIVQLVVTDAMPGDYNRDNMVDAADYLVWRKMFGASVADFASADGTGDGTIDNDDYDVWLANFGQVYSGGSGGSESVPEPATILLLAACGLSLTPRMRMDALASSFQRRRC